jgi:hypothetical protein
MAFSMVSFEDIPWETIVNYIAPHLTMKEYGALAMQNTFLRELFHSNDVWKRLYVNTCLDKLTITEKSVHVGPLQSGPDSEVFQPPCKLEGYEIWRYTGNPPPHGYERVFNTRRNLLCCGCVEIADIEPLTAQIRSYRIPLPRVVGQIGPPEGMEQWCNEEVYPKIRQYNKEKYGIDCLCTNKHHYLIETLDAPKNVRNFKDYRKQTLSKTLTSVKGNKEIKARESAVCRNKKKIKNFERAIEELQKLNMDNQVHISKSKRLMNSLKHAIGK